MRVRIVKPGGSTELLPVLLYLHGGGWVLGSAATPDRLVCELAVGVYAAVVFVDYARSPEVHYPAAIEQAYETARWIHRHGRTHGLDAAETTANNDEFADGPHLTAKAMTWFQVGGPELMAAIADSPCRGNRRPLAVCFKRM